jgi:hypothetical protein
MTRVSVGQKPDCADTGTTAKGTTAKAPAIAAAIRIEPIEPVIGALQPCLLSLAAGRGTVRSYHPARHAAICLRAVNKKNWLRTGAEKLSVPGFNVVVALPMRDFRD